ncbi:MAG: four helix bundle protein [Flavobacterium sp.]|uniref:four helix bundle protein n=1 Tax=Flavobacterium sp. TaxID=239 RepID=UPI0022C09681|nr:four helix bundle protein [Flavobacterium sp.]MCZ8329897.1 four helix bundle protein [Flavobacterium sp.]
MRHNYKNLKVWQLGIEIANDISDILLEFTKHERYDLSSQMSHCSVSIPSNIAEGSSRTDKSFSHFVDIALGSSFELITQLIVAKHRKYIDEETFIKLEKKIEEFQRMTMSFQNGLKKSIFSIIPSIFYSLFSIF